MISQAEIAKIVGIDRTAVSKILNGHTNSFSQKTIKKVLQVANEKNYEFSRIGFKHSRKSKRIPVQCEVEIEIYLSHGRKFDKGMATIVCISECGALSTDIVTKKGVFPIEPFTVLMKIIDGELKGLILEGEVVRLAKNGLVNMGIKFKRLPRSVKAKLERYLNHRKTEEIKL